MRLHPAHEPLMFGYTLGMTAYFFRFGSWMALFAFLATFKSKSLL